MKGNERRFEVRCIACGGSSLETAFQKHGFDIRRCRACGHGRTAGHDGFEPEHYYSEAYFQGGHADAYADYSGSEEILRSEFRRTVQYLVRVGGRRRRLLELGCAYGFLLEEARPYFETMRGIDISSDAVRVCRQKGLDAVAGVADEQTLDGTYDAVIGLDVIEHVPEPQETLRLLAAHMPSGGLLLMTTGDWGAWSARLMGASWRLMTPPQHLSFFTKRSMTAMLDSAGFRVVSLTHPGKHVPFTLVAFQLQRILGLKPRQIGFFRNVALPVNLWDAMRVVALKR